MTKWRFISEHNRFDHSDFEKGIAVFERVLFNKIAVLERTEQNLPLNQNSNAVKTALQWNIETFQRKIENQKKKKREVQLCWNYILATLYWRGQRLTVDDFQYLLKIEIFKLIRRHYQTCWQI